jgi:uncharacterized membrane protein YkvA (DUF1232 family)
MLAAQLQSHVETILAQPQADRRLHARIEEFAAAGGTTLGPHDKDGLTAFCRGYIRAVADLLLACDRAATQAGAIQFAGPLLQSAAGYFLQQRDYIPDESGTFGLLDDAYLACRLVARTSEVVAAARGMPLLDTALDQHSPTVRVLIGEPLASRVDGDIEQTMAQVAAQLQFAQMQQLQLQRGAWNDWAQQQNVINTEAEIMSIASGGF